MIVKDNSDDGIIFDRELKFPKEFSELDNLEFLDIAIKWLEKINYDNGTFVNLNKIEKLRIQSKFLKELPQELLENPNLKEIQLTFHPKNEKKKFRKKYSKLLMQLKWIKQNTSIVVSFDDGSKDIVGKASKRKLTLSPKRKQNTTRFGKSHIYITGFSNPPFEITLREKPNVMSNEIYKCPKDSKVYVLEKTTNQYYKVKVDDKIVYISKSWLKRKH